MAEPGKTVTACLIVIGNEILSGRTQDKNISFLAARLNEIGVALREVRVIPDVTETIVRTVNECRPAFDYVFTTGGIGPTHDDITSDSVARAFGVRNVLNEHARRILFDHYGDENVNETRLRMAHIPEGAELIENPISKAPGYQIENVFVLAGVPAIMRAMFESLRHRLDGGARVRSHTISAGLPEGRIATAFGKLQDAYGDVEMGSYPYFRGGVAGCSLVLRSTDEGRLAQAVDELRALVRKAGGEPVDEVTGWGAMVASLTGGPAYLVRLADFDDAAGIGNVHVVGWRSAYRDILPEEYLEGMSDIRHSAFWAEVLDTEGRAGATFIAEAEGGDGIVGFADCGPDRQADDPAAGEIFALYVVPKWTRHGVGRTLVEACAGHLAVGGANALTIRVLERNEAACAFYEALGGVAKDKHGITVAGVAHIEVNYRWDDIRHLAGLDPLAGAEGRD